MRNVIIIAAMLAAFSVPAQATKMTDGRAMPGTGCVMQTNVTLGVNFNFTSASLSEAKAKYDERMLQITNFAKKMEIEKFEPQSMNYNIYSQQNGGINTYQLNGSVQYQLKSEEVAFKFAEFLEKEKFNVNVSSNAYRTGNCAH